MENLYGVIVTLITVIGGSTAFSYYERRANRRHKDDEYIRVDYSKRIAKLESLLLTAGKEKDDLRALVLSLTSQVAELRVKVEFLTDENGKLTRAKRKKQILND
jgi:hypothetical protein